MGAKIYDTTSQAFVDAEIPKVNSGGVFTDAEGKVYSGGAWKDAWSKGGTGAIPVLPGGKSSYSDSYGSATSSGHFGPSASWTEGTYGTTNAFDNNPESGWGPPANINVWISYVFTNRIDLSNVYFEVGPNDKTTNVAYFSSGRLDVTTDGTNWTTLINNLSGINTYGAHTYTASATNIRGVKFVGTTSSTNPNNTIALMKTFQINV